MREALPPSSGGPLPNLGSVLREEIARLSKRALRADVASVKKASAMHRRHIAALKRQIADLERKVAQLARRGNAAPASADADKRPIRFVAKGLRSQRNRLGLSASEFGKLVGVSPQTIYNWEHEAARPAREQLARLVALRGLGKREAGKRLAAMAGNGDARRKRRSK